MPISFSSILGGPELDNTPIDHITHSIGEDMEEVPLPEGDAELVIFLYVPGKLEKPSFKGIRIGRFSRKDKTLQIEISVPRRILSSPELLHELAVLLKRAVRKGKAYLTKKRIEFS